VAENRTTKHELDEGRFAGFAERLQAFLWDYLVLLVYIATLVVIALNSTGVQSLFQGPVKSDIMAFLLLVGPVILYFSLQECSQKQASFGKRKRRIKVIRLDGQPISLRQAFCRSCLAFLPWQLAHTAVFHTVQPGLLPTEIVLVLFIMAYGLIALSGLMIWKGEMHRAPWDKVTGTAVIKMHD
jgi:uncharacterized RDD family membrane protein YckC